LPPQKLRKGGAAKEVGFCAVLPPPPTVLGSRCFLMMQIETPDFVIDEVVQIRFFEHDLDMLHSGDNPSDHFLWGFWALGFRQSLIARFSLRLIAQSTQSINDRLNALCVNHQVIRLIRVLER
jgi:hypothetical protein